MYSCLIRGATLIDGSGGEPCRKDVALAGDRIGAVGADLKLRAAQVIEGGGLVLSPGFIDIHGHSDMTLFRHPLLESKLFQGVTTEVTGNCGLGLFPVRHGGEEELARYLTIHDFTLPPEGITWHDFSGYGERVTECGLALNVAPLVGHAALRMAAMGMDDRAPTATERERMVQLLAKALTQGAWGMSTGLIYPPGSYALTGELVALAQVLHRYDALYTSHIRSESEGLFTAIEEAIALGVASGARLQISHLKALGNSNFGRGGELLEKLAAARREGVDIGADQYPYDASATTLTAVVPPWAHAGGVGCLLERLADPLLQKKLHAEINGEIARREGADGIMVTGCHGEPNRGLSGKTVAHLAHLWNCSPAEVVIRLIREEEGKVGAIFFSMAERDVRTILADPLVAVGSDGHGLHSVLDGAEATHPRSYGTFPRVLGHYVREEKLLPLTTAVHKMTLLPARRLGCLDRGLVAPGYVADLLLFDPETVGETATYTAPHCLATGVRHLLVAGRPVLRDGVVTGERPGRVLKKTDMRMLS